MGLSLRRVRPVHVPALVRPGYVLRLGAGLCRCLWGWLVGLLRSGELWWGCRGRCLWWCWGMFCPLSPFSPTSVVTAWTNFVARDAALRVLVVVVGVVEEVVVVSRSSMQPLGDIRYCY